MSAQVDERVSRIEATKLLEPRSIDFDDEDPLAAAKGTVFALLLSSLFWIALLLVFNLIF